MMISRDGQQNDQPAGYVSQFYNLVKDKDSAAQIEKLEMLEGPENFLRGKLKGGGISPEYSQQGRGLLTVIRENVSDFSVKPAQTFWSQLIFLSCRFCF